MDKHLIKNIVVFLAVLLAGSAPHADAQHLNDKLQNRPYADLRKWHLGFGVGLHTQNFSFTHTGTAAENGEIWFAEQPDYSPAFNVCGLFEYRLSKYFSLRTTPGLYFGNRLIRMTDESGELKEKQDIKSAHLVLPVEVKFAGERLRNARPYLVGGIMPAFDVAKKRADLLKLKSTDFYLTVGFGCDFYLPYFKLNPELKFCFGFSDMLDRNRPDLADNPEQMKFTNAIKKMTSSMVVLTFYFE